MDPKVLAALGAALVTLWCVSVEAEAAVLPKLFQVGSSGGAAGEMVTPRGISSDAQNGHQFVADIGNNRVAEFTPWGEFVKAFGWDVAPGAVEEEQEIRIRATAGQFRLSFDVSTTGSLPFDAGAQEVETALNDLSSISSGGGKVVVSGGPGGIAGTTPSVYVVRFAGPSFAGSDVDQLGIDDGSTPLSGGSPTLKATATRADGSAVGVGPEVCTAASECQPGIAGAAAGQFNNPGGMEVDEKGNVYVFERSNFRVQKFNSAGQFLWMIGGGVNQTTGEDTCTLTDIGGGDECGAGVSGNGIGEFQVVSVNGTAGDYIAVNPAGNLYVADRGRVQEFDSGGNFVRQIDLTAVLPAPVPPAAADSGALAVDPIDGNLYFSFSQGVLQQERTNGVFKLSEVGGLLDTLDVESPEALATDSEGNVYAVESPRNEIGNLEPPRVVAFDTDGNVMIGSSERFALPAQNGASLTGLGTSSIGDVYVGNSKQPLVSYVEAFGPPPLSFEPAPPLPPDIEDQYAASVGETEATVQTVINPKFWADTRFFVEYGTDDCDVIVCAKVPAPPGDLLTSDVVDAPIKSEGVVLNGLAEDTTYNFRFVAESSGGGPVVGVGGTGAEGSFTTRREPTEPDACPGNELPRTALSQTLPDCRAFELVSPLDKEGADVVALCENSCFSAGLNQSAAAGSKLTYSAFKSYGEAESAPYTSQYLSKRIGGKGWENDNINPPQEGPSPFGLTQSLDTLYKAFSPELEYGWWIQTRQPALSEGSDAPNIYRREMSTGDYDPLAPQALNDMPEVQGTSADGSCTVFRVKDKLTGNAKVGLSQVYETCDGTIALVSVLPNGTASAKDSSAGTPIGLFANGRQTNVFNAISDNGSRVFWSEANSAPGPLYVRIDGAVTKAIAAAGAMFWGASSSGDKVIYEEGSTLKEASISETGVVTPTTIAAQGEGVMGISEDASRVYFVSRADLDSGGPAQVGKPNLYLRDAGVNEFLVALTELDVPQFGQTSPVAPAPIRHQARANPSGSHLVFMSRGQLTGYDNTDQNSGEADAEVFLYDAGEEELRCVSCNPTGARPVGKELLVGLEGSQPTGIWAAAQIPTLESQLYGSRVLSADGTRVYFESFDQLDPAHTGTKGEVYQWEQLGAGGPEGGCDKGDSSFDPVSGGCISLISSGDSPTGAEFVDASADGKDVFFTTSASLVAYDPGLIDVYDARVGGGLPEPPPVVKECEGEACPKPATPPPAVPNPPSQNPGQGNVKPKKCPKGKHLVTKKGKETCVKNKKKKKKSNKGKKKGSKQKSGKAGR